MTLRDDAIAAYEAERARRIAGAQEEVARVFNERFNRTTTPASWKATENTDAIVLTQTIDTIQFKAKRNNQEVAIAVVTSAGPEPVGSLVDLGRVLATA